MPIFHNSRAARIVAGCVVVVLLLLLLDSMISDYHKSHELDTNPDLWYVPGIPHTHQDQINRMIDNYFRRRSLNKSSRKKMIKCAVESAARGAIGGCMTGGVAGVLPGAIVYGALGAVTVGIKRLHPSDDRNVVYLQKF